VAFNDIKGLYPRDLHEKYDLIKSAKEREYIVDSGEFGNFGFWVKAANLKYKPFPMTNRVNTPRPVPYEFGQEENHYSGNVLVIQSVNKYFHDILEILPWILTLKNAGENFTILLCSNQPVAENKMFIGMDKEDKMGYQPIHYWKEILDYLEVKYECLDLTTMNRFSCENSYMFYYTDCGTVHGMGFDNVREAKVPGLIQDLYFPDSYIIFPLSYFTTFIHADAYDILTKSLKPLISKMIPGKKIFITRDTAVFTDRSIDNSKELTDYMESQGFEIFRQEEYIWPEQIKKITTAEYVVSLVGSGFINAMLCNKQTKMISIHTDKSQDFMTYSNQAARWDIDFKSVYCDPDGLDIIDYFKTSTSEFTRKVIDNGK